MDAESGARRRPWWRLSDPTSSGDRLVFRALTAYRYSILEGRYTEQHEIGGFNHFARRLEERDLDLADVLRAVAVGRICTFKPRHREWIGGGFLWGDIMVYVAAPAPLGSNFAALLPNICSAWRVDDPPCLPLTASIGELAQIGDAVA